MSCKPQSHWPGARWERHHLVVIIRNSITTSTTGWDLSRSLHCDDSFFPIVRKLEQETIKGPLYCMSRVYKKCFCFLYIPPSSPFPLSQFLLWFLSTGTPKQWSNWFPASPCQFNLKHNSYSDNSLFQSFISFLLSLSSSLTTVLSIIIHIPYIWCFSRWQCLGFILRSVLRDSYVKRLSKYWSSLFILCLPLCQDSIYSSTFGFLLRYVLTRDCKFLQDWIREEYTFVYSMLT